MWGVRGRALSHPRLPALWSGCRGPLHHWLWVRGGAGVGTRHLPHSARSCVLRGRHDGARGGRLLPGCGASGVGRSPTPDCPPSGRAARAHYPLAVGAGGCWRGDPSPTPQRALLRAGFARCGGGTRAPGGVASCLCVGPPGSGALPASTAHPLGGLPGPASHWPWVRCAGVGTRLSLAPCPVPRFVVCCAHFPGSRHPVAVVAWHLSSCLGCGRQRASLACLVAPRWCAAPRPVRSLSVLRSALPLPWCLPPPRGLSPQALLGGCAGHVEAGREPGSLCLPPAPAEARALGALRVVPVRGPAMGSSLAGPSGFGLGLRALRRFGVCGPGH